MTRIRQAGGVICLLFFAGVSVAQVGGFTVVVSDAAGDALAGATVTISQATGFVKTTSEVTDAKGIVRFPVLRPGKGYKIEVSFPGYSPLRYEDLHVRLNEQQQLRVRMIEEVREEVRVTAERSVVDLDETESSTKFSGDFIGDLPVLDRFYQNVLTMAPGIQDADGDGNPNVHGSRTRDFQALVGGVSNVDPLTGQWLSRINPNSIEEMEVISAGAGVEFGRAQGGYARIIQKQGSNRHEGIVEFHYQTSDLDGDGANDPSDLPAPDFETRQPGFQFSGPVIKDRLWYRASYERRYREEPVNVLSGISIYTNDSETRDAQLTWQVSPRNKLALQYRSDPADENNFGISSRIPAESSQRRGRDVDTWSLTWTAPFSPKILVETLTSWQEVNLSTGPAVENVKNSCVPNSVTGFLGTAPCLNLVTNQISQISGSFNESNDDRRQRFTVKSQATVYGGRFWGADHQFKLGVAVENERYFRELHRSPSITYEEVHPAFGVPFAIVLADVDVPGDDNVRDTGTNWAVYAEDQLKPLSNLTMTIGARVDHEELNAEGKDQMFPDAELEAYESTLGFVDDVPINLYTVGDWENYFTGFESMIAFREQVVDILCADLPAAETGNCQATTSPNIFVQLNENLAVKRKGAGMNLRNTNVSPFLSVAWDPWGNGKTALKASVGRHYNNVPLIVPLQELEPVRSTIEYRAELQNFLTDINNAIPRITVRTVDRSLKTPYQDELALSIEREIWPETSLRVSYINRSYEDQFQDQNLNVKVDDYGVCASPFTQIQFRTNVIPLALDKANRGDGNIDDCGGITSYSGGDQFGNGAFVVQSPDGFPDLYLLNPFWGGINQIGNINEWEYDGLVLELVRRQYRNWEMIASYTYSEVKGFAEEFLPELYNRGIWAVDEGGAERLANDPSQRDSIRGYQSYDQRHVAKLNATTTTPWGVRLGTRITWQSGLPYSIVQQGVSDDILPPTTSVFLFPGTRRRQTYPTGVRNDQRNKSYWNVDFMATKELQLGRGTNLRLSIEVFNALNDDTYQIYNPFFESGQSVCAFNAPLSSCENEAQRRFGRRWQLGARLAF